jgi:tetratricopeptide (TPR) repeat protein
MTGSRKKSGSSRRRIRIRDLQFDRASILLFCSMLLPLVNPEAAGQRKTQTRAGGASAEVGAPRTSLNPKAKAAVDRAVAALQKDDLASAETAAREAVAAAPASAVTHNVLGVVLDRGGRSDQALAEFEAAIKLDPKLVSARNNIGGILAEKGKTSEAIKQFEVVLGIDPTHVQAHFNLGSLFAERGDFEKAVTHLVAARRSSPDDPQVALALLKVGYRANRIKEAEEAADFAEKALAADPRALFTLATLLAQNKVYDRAARLFEQVNRAAPRTYEVLYNLGVALYNLDRNDEAAQYLAEAADLNPAPPETHFRLALIASARNDSLNAVEEFRHAVERDGQNASYRHLLGREYFRAGFWEGAINELSAAIRIDPKNAAYFLARADANYRKGEWAASAADFDQAAALDPNIENIEYWQGYAHRAAGDFDLARKYLERFLSRHPDHVEALASQGYVAIEQGRLDEAEPPLRRALALDPKNVPVLYDFARLAIKRRSYDDAVARLLRVIESNPANTQAYYQLFLAYSRLKQTDKAQVALAEFKRLDELEKQATQERILDEKVRVQQMLGQPQ